MNAFLAFSLRLLLVLLSYAFVGWVIYTIFADIKRGTSKEKAKTVPPITLNAQIEDESLSKRFRQPEIVLGRDPATDFPLDDETISLRHSKLHYHHKHWWVKDLESTNGTYLNNSLITMETILTDDDRINLGKVEIAIFINQNVELE